MDIKQYAVLRKNTDDDSTYALTRYILGIAGEAGEVVELLKKSTGNSVGKSEIVTAIALELGDVVWYALGLVEKLQLDLSEVVSDVGRYGTVKLSAIDFDALLCSDIELIGVCETTQLYTHASAIVTLLTSYGNLVFVKDDASSPYNVPTSFYNTAPLYSYPMSAADLADVSPGHFYSITTKCIKSLINQVDVLIAFYNLSWSDVLAKNVEKLAKRYPQGFTGHRFG